MSIVWVGAVMVLSVVLSFVLTLLLGFEDIPETEPEIKTAPESATQPAPVTERANAINSH